MRKAPKKKNTFLFETEKQTHMEHIHSAFCRNFSKDLSACEDITAI